MIRGNSKVAVPQTAMKAIDRQRLYDALRIAGARRLTVLRAPAGYGKTTLLSQWFSQSTDSVAWVTIDALDNDPIRFWKSIIHIVSNAADNGIKQRIFSLFDEQSPLELVVDSLLNEIGLIPTTISIVIDDVYLLENEEIHLLLDRFISYLPSNAQVYMTSRTKLPFPIAKWRVKGWLIEIGMEQLRFTIEEAERFFALRGLVPEEDGFLQNVLELTEGWAAGLQLTTLSGVEGTVGNRDGIRGDHPLITDYLLQEILASLSVTKQDFLVRTSLVNQLEPTICNELTGRTDGEDILMELEMAGLFIVRLHVSEPIFRYHHLFADVLQIEMRRRFSEHEIAILYEDTAALIREQGDFVSAIELVLSGKLYGVADEWISAHLIEIYLTGQMTTLIRWVNELRAAEQSVNVETLVMLAITFSTRHEIAEAEKLIAELELRQKHEGWKQKEEFQGMAYILETVKAFVLIAQGKKLELAAEIIHGQVKHGRVSSHWDHIPMQYNQFEPQTLRTSIGSRGKLWNIGEFLPFFQLFQKSEFNDQNMTGFGYAVLAETLYEQNYINEALSLLEEAMDYGHRFKDNGLIIPMYLLKARIHNTKGEFIEAHALVDYALDTTEEKYWRRVLSTMKAQCHLREGTIQEAKQQLFHTTALHNQVVESGQAFWMLVHARILLADKQVKRALETVRRVKEQALLENQIATIIEAAVLETVCLMKLSNEKEALVVLHNALEQGARYGYVRTFLDESDVVHLLNTYLKVRRLGTHTEWNTVPLVYVEHLVTEEQKEQEEPIQNPLLKLLTSREQEILQLLASGASNSEIASQLVLKEGTVRVYLTSIYEKLGVDSRTQAIVLFTN